MKNKYKLKNFLLLTLLYTILFLNSSISYANELEINQPLETEQEDIQQEDISAPNLNGYGAILIDANTGISLYEKNANEKLYPASMTKVMTVILTLEYGNLNETITHSHNAVFNIGQGSSHIGMREGEEITLEQALYAMLLASANEVCMAVAEHISGSVENFVDKMNEKAKELGALNTHFANPHGFHDENHYTTPYDMSLIMQEAIKYEKFLEVISTETYIIPETNLVDEVRTLNNTNRMIKTWSEFYYPNMIGGKTGFTDQAKNTLTAYAKNEDINLISVVMKADGTEVYADTAKLLDYGFTLFKEQTIFKSSSFSETTSVIQNFQDKEISLGEIEVKTEEDLIISLPKTIDTEKIIQTVNLPENIEGPVYVGDIVGTIDFLYNNHTIGSVNIISNTEIETIPETTLIKKEKIQSYINLSLKILKYIIIFIIVFFIVIFISSSIVRRTRKNKRKKLRFSNYNTNYSPYDTPRKRKSKNRRRF